MYTLKTFYRSDEWERLIARLKLERVDDNGQLICAYCGKPITRKYDCIGHHETTLTEDNVNDFAISLNPNNIKLIHFGCHNRIHKRNEGFCQKVYLVYGSPCSGKSTWVKEVANKDDLILDLDDIWEAVCLCDRYHKPKRLRAVVFGIRDCIIDQVRMRKGFWRNAYIIGGYPLAPERDRLCDLLGAEPVYIEATEAECMARAQTEEWRDYVREWFASFTA